MSRNIKIKYLFISLNIFPLHILDLIHLLNTMKKPLPLSSLSLVKISLPMLSKATCQDQSIPSCSTSPYPLQNFAQASNFRNKFFVYIKATLESIDVFDHVAHSKDVDISFHYPFASPKSILGPHPSNLKPSNLPSILGPYVPSYSIHLTPSYSSTSPITPQD